MVDLHSNALVVGVEGWYGIFIVIIFHLQAGLQAYLLREYVLRFELLSWMGLWVWKT